MTKGRNTTNCMDMNSLSSKMTIGQIVRDVLHQAKEEKRLTCGLYESGLLLEMSPESVMLCILPQDKSNDVTLDIHYTLIQAFCLENAVSLIKVDSSDKLTQLLGDRPHTYNPQQVPDCDDLSLLDPNDNECYLQGPWLEGSTDYNCVLVEFPASKFTDQEEDLLHYHKATCVEVPQPIIDLVV